MVRVAFGLLAAAVLLLAASSVPSRASAEATLAGDIPVDGGFGLVIFGGGSLEALRATAEASGCAVTSVFASRQGAFVPHIVGAPAFANADFATLYPAGIPADTPLILGCAPPAGVAVDAATPYLVQPGDTLVSIADRHHVSVNSIMWANNLPDSDHLTVGQALRVPSRVTGMFTIGESNQGRPIEVGCRGAGARTALLVGGIHTGPVEGVTAAVTRELARLLWNGTLPVPDGVRVCVLPVLNPDGVAIDERTNGDGVDLNRNWPADNWTATAYHPGSGGVSGGQMPLSEPEAYALHQYILEDRPAVVVVWHCCGAVVEGNAVAPAKAYADRYARAAGLAYIEQWAVYRITGQFSQAMDRLGIPALDVEMVSSGDVDVVQHRAGVSAVLDALAHGP